MIMAETVMQTFNSLNIDSKRLYQKRKSVQHDIPSIYSNTNSVNSSTTNTNDWHRLLLARLKPGMTGKYRTTRTTGNKFDSSLSTSLDESNVTLQSYSDDSSIIDNHQIILAERDASKYFDTFKDNSIKRDNHFVKNSIANRNTDHITSLKRRVRKQQMRHFQSRPTILHESTFQLPSPNNLLMVSYPEQTVSSRRYRQKKLNCLVSLPPIMNTTKVRPTYMHGIKLNLFGY